jgi:hypothetical protein
MSLLWESQDWLTAELISSFVRALHKNSSSRGFAARYEAGLSPAVSFRKDVGLMWLHHYHLQQLPNGL